MLSPKPAFTSLDNLDGVGQRYSQSAQLPGPSSCASTPLFLPRSLAETPLLSSSGDSYLSKFAASIESMQRSSEVLETVTQAGEIGSRGPHSSLDGRQGGDVTSDLSDSDLGLSEPPPSADSVFDNKAANRWVELTNIDVSPVLPQRKSWTFCESARQVLNKIDPSSVRCYQASPGPRRALVSTGLASNGELNPPRDPNEGSLHFKFQYLIVTERLKVTVVEASNMLKAERPDTEISAYAEVCLMPGKLQRQFSKPVRATSNTTFQHVVYFHGISLFETHQMCLRIKIMTKERLLKTPRIIGEVTVSLDDFDLVSETTMEENFNTRIGSRSGSRHGLRRITVL